MKTHHPDNRELPRDVQESTGKKFYDRAVVLVRNPYDALISEANRRWNTKANLDSHVGLADETSFIGKILFFSIVLFFLLLSWSICATSDVHLY